MLNLKGLNRAQALAALYNASRPQGMGFLHYNPTPMTEAEAEDHLSKSKYFDYLNGRVMKLNMGRDEIEPRLYDRDNGEGAAQRAIDAAVAGNEAAIMASHIEGVKAAARAAVELDEDAAIISTKTDRNNHIHETIHLSEDGALILDKILANPNSPKGRVQGSGRKLKEGESVDIYNQTDEQLEERLNKHKHTMRLMLIVFVVVITLNVLFVAAIIQFEPLSDLLQIVVALPLAVINMLSIWWLCS